LALQFLSCRERITAYEQKSIGCFREKQITGFDSPIDGAWGCATKSGRAFGRDHWNNGGAFCAPKVD